MCSPGIGEDNMLAKFIMFGLFGICAQLVVTALIRTIMNRRLELTGEASIVLMPIYGLIGFIYPIIAIHTGSIPWYLRGIIYMLAFYVFQYFAGLLLTKIHICPWKYSGGWSFHGLIRVADAPVWFLAGLAIEQVYPYAKAASNVI